MTPPEQTAETWRCSVRTAYLMGRGEELGVKIEMTDLMADGL